MIKLNGQVITLTLFPDHTSQVWHLDETQLKRGFICVEWEWEDEREVMHLAQLKTLIDHYSPDACTLLEMHYLPYARQDKEVSNETSFALTSFATVVNSLKFTCVKVFDSHNYGKTYSLFKEAVVIVPIVNIEQAARDVNPTLLCYPDLGALKRYHYAMTAYKSMYAEKVREPSSGKILSLKLVGHPLGHTVLIVDDICDGGSTFILLAQQLLANGAKAVHLYVSHGLFTKGVACLYQAGIKSIHTRKGRYI